MAVRKISSSWWIDITFNGKRYRKRSPANTKEGAKNFETIIRNKLINGESLEDENKEELEQNYKSYSKKWFNGYVVVNNKYSEIKSKESILQRHIVPYFGKLSLNRITNYHVEQFKAQKLKEGYSKKSIDNHLAVLRKSLGTAKDWFNLDPIPKIKFFKEPTAESDFLTQEESELLLKHADGTWNLMIRLAVRTGLRLGELIALDWEDVNLDNTLITVKSAIVRNVKGTPKSNKSRYVPIAPDLVDALNAQPEKEGFVFTYRDKFLKTDYCSNSLARICEKAGLRRIGWHTLRHSFASQLVMNNIPMTSVQKLMGHQDIQTTMRYAHLAPSFFQDSVNSLTPENYHGQKTVKEQNVVLATKEEREEIMTKINKKQDINPV